MLTNIRGFNSKKLSLKHVVNEHVDVLLINETHSVKNQRVKFEGFKCFSRNREGNNWGGIASCVTGVKDKTPCDCLKH